jgi:hypothetical protein
MRQILIELNIPGKNYGELFILEKPESSEDEFYTQTISYQWFMERELKRAFPDVSGKLINGMNWVEYSRTIKHCAERETHATRIKEYLDNASVDINTVPVCKGVWDFYDKIGYDHKRKKYK